MQDLLCAMQTFRLEWPLIFLGVPNVACPLLRYLCSIWPCPFKYLFGTSYFLGQWIGWSEMMFRTTLYLLSKASVISWFVACCRVHPNVSRRFFCLSSRNLCFCHLDVFFLNMLFRFTGKGRYHVYWVLGEPSPHRRCGSARSPPAWGCLHRSVWTSAP